MQGPDVSVNILPILTSFKTWIELVHLRDQFEGFEPLRYYRFDKEYRRDQWLSVISISYCIIAFTNCVIEYSSHIIYHDVFLNFFALNVRFIYSKIYLFK